MNTEETMNTELFEIVEHVPTTTIRATVNPNAKLFEKITATAEKLQINQEFTVPSTAFVGETKMSSQYTNLVRLLKAKFVGDDSIHVVCRILKNEEKEIVGFKFVRKS